MYVLAYYSVCLCKKELLLWTSISIILTHVDTFRYYISFLIPVELLTTDEEIIHKIIEASKNKR